MRPQDLHNAYDLPDAVEASPTQTVALVDAYDDPTAESDLRVFDEEMELPACTSENGCFVKVNQGESLRACRKRTVNGRLRSRWTSRPRTQYARTVAFCS